jgi:hypothetical protein
MYFYIYLFLYSNIYYHFVYLFFSVVIYFVSVHPVRASLWTLPCFDRLPEMDDPIYYFHIPSREIWWHIYVKDRISWWDLRFSWRFFSFLITYLPHVNFTVPHFSHKTAKKIAYTLKGFVIKIIDSKVGTPIYGGKRSFLSNCACIPDELYWAPPHQLTFEWLKNLYETW